MNIIPMAERGRISSTTVVAVRGADGAAAMACDGQVTLGDRVLKSSAVKIRALHDGKVLAGFAGSTADALALFELFEGRLDQYRGDLSRAAVELAKQWRTDRMLRRLDAVLLAVDGDDLLIISGTGDVVAPDEPFAAVGSGAGYAVAALKAVHSLGDHSAPGVELPGVATLARLALSVAAGLCIYTNDEISLLELPGGGR